MLKFKSKYSIRLYEFAKSIHYDETVPYSRILSIENLLRVARAEKYAADWHEAKRRAILPALAEINENSDKIIKIEEIQERRRVVAVEFEVATKLVVVRW